MRICENGIYRDATVEEFEEIRNLPELVPPVEQRIDNLETTSAHKTNDGTVLSSNADFAEIGEWSDDNLNNEDRIGYFVSVDKTEAGITMVKANSTSDVRGVTMLSPGFAGNASDDKFNEQGELLSKYSYVGFAGFVSVIDNGTCTINERCVSADDGTAIPSPNNMGYQVIDRIDDTHVLILVEPSADMLVRIKEDVSDKVDKEDGKGLSTNDYDDAAKVKVDAIPDDPKYTDTIYDDSELRNKILIDDTEFLAMLEEVYV